MNTESIANLVLVCEECSQPDLKYMEYDNDYFIGKYVKIGFESQEGPVEHCWVMINTSGKEGSPLGAGVNQFIGTLGNDPLFDIGLTCGDTVIVYKNQIEDVFEA